jgi:Papain-like cysteine protease AvrRpt2
MTVSISDQDAIEIPLTATDTGAQQVRDLDVELVQQGSHVNLCWAACCTMLTKSYAKHYPKDCGQLPIQLEAVARHVINSNACDTDPHIGIDQGCFPDCVLKTFIVDAKPIPCEKTGPTSEHSLIDQITNGKKPVMLYIIWNTRITDQSIAHVVLLSGYDPVTKQFRINDPREGLLRKSFTWLHDYGGRAQWFFTYFDIGFSLDGNS